MNLLKKLFQKKNFIITTLTISSSNGFHLRPIAKFVNEVKKYPATITLLAKNSEVLATQLPKILSLSLEKGDTFELKVTGKNAQQTSKELTLFFEKLMQEDRLQKNSKKEQLTQEHETYEANALKGKILSKGVGIGRLISYVKKQTITEKKISLSDAIKKTQEDLTQLYEANKNNPEAEIFLAHQALLNDDIFHKNFNTIEKEIEKLQGGKFESRMADYRDIKKRIESHMGIEEKFTLPKGDEKSYIIMVDKAQELLPSEVESLSKLPISGVILHQGSTTSHTAILLRSFQIPTIIYKEEIPLSNHSSLSLLDASSAQLVLTPTPNDLNRANHKIKKLKEVENQAYANRFQCLMSNDKKPIKILANITNVQSAKEAKEQGADGIGLFRTEFLFTQKQPTIQEQTQAYQEVFELFDDVTIRTLDIGGDKALPYINMPKEENPFLGLRGIRFSLQEQILFKEQLLAIFQAVNQTASNHKTIKIMFPMVAIPQEFIEAKTIAQEVAKEHKLDITNIQFGMMLEVPSVIFAIKAFDKLVDFYSIGSNDLTQYLFAIERTHPTLTVDPTSPILFEALKQIINTTSKPLSICGELAGEEEATVLLLKIGYLNLSVSSKLIPNLKNNINNI